MIVVLALFASGCESRETVSAPPTPLSPKKKLPGDDGSMPDIARTTCKISSMPPGAEIFINGKTTGEVTPSSVNLWAGKVSRVEVKKKGYFTGSSSLAPNLNQDTAHDFTLTPSVQVRVDSTPAGATVLVDGQRTAITPSTVEVSLGAHVLSFQMEGHVDFAQPIVAASTALDVKARLSEAAFLRLQTYPSTADVYLDGELVKSPLPARLPVSARQKHFVTVAGEGYTPDSDVVGSLTEGETERLSMTLETAKPERLQKCARKAHDRLAWLERTLKKARAAAPTAGVADSIELKEQISLAEREVAVRRLEVGFCAPHPSAP